MYVVSKAYGNSPGLNGSKRREQSHRVQHYPPSFIEHKKQTILYEGINHCKTPYRQVVEHMGQVMAWQAQLLLLVLDIIVMLHCLQKQVAWAQRMHRETGTRDLDR